MGKAIRRDYIFGTLGTKPTRSFHLLNDINLILLRWFGEETFFGVKAIYATGSYKEHKNVAQVDQLEKQLVIPAFE